MEKVPRKISSKNRLLILGIGIAILIGLGLYFFVFADALGKPPSVIILQPGEPPALYSGEGLMLEAQGIAARGVARIEFFVDGIEMQEQVISSPEMKLATANFPWFSSGIGTHELSVVAYDALGKASEPAQVQVEVQAKLQELREAYLKDFQVVSEEEPGAQFGEGSGGEEGGGQEMSGEALEGSDGAEPGQGTGAEQGEAPAQVPGDQEGQVEDAAAEEAGAEDAAAPEAGFPGEEEVDGPQDEDPPPSLILDISFERQGEGGLANLSLLAEDDLGVDWIELRILNEDGDGHRPLQSFCDGAQVCEFNLVFPIEMHQWWFTAIAFDLAGQASVPQFWQMEAMGEPQAFAFHDALFDSALAVSPEGLIRLEPVLDAFAPLPNEGDANGDGDEDLDQEWIDYVLQERPESFLINGCLIVQPVVLPMGPFTECQHWDLHGVDLSGVDLRYANFGHSDLSDAQLDNANLEGAIIGGGNLSDANLSGANMTNIQLDYTNLTGAIMDNNTMVSLKWRQVRTAITNWWEHMHFENVDFRFAYLRSADLHDSTIRGDLTGADMRGANLEKATLNGSIAARILLMGSNLSSSHLNNVNFHDAKLADANLTDAHLRESDLRHADLNGTELDGADLSSADLSRASLSGWGFESVNFSGAKLRDAKITGVYFLDCDLTGADFYGARLAGTNISDDSLTDYVNWREVTLPPGDDPYDYFRWYDAPVWLAVNSGGLGDRYRHEVVAYAWKFPVGIKLIQKDLRGADLYDADLSEVLLMGSWLQRADLRKADLRGADLSHANLSAANLQGADLFEVTMENANLTDAYLNPVKLVDAHLGGSNFFSADLRGSELMQADLHDVDMREADLRGANLHYAEGLIAENLVGALWENTTCPDGTNSDDNNDTCVDHLFVYTGQFEGD